MRLRRPLAVSALALVSLPGWYLIWFLDGEFGPAGTDDWTMAEAWSGPLAISIAVAFCVMCIGVALLWFCATTGRLPRLVSPLAGGLTLMALPPAAVFVVLLVATLLS